MRAFVFLTLLHSQLVALSGCKLSAQKINSPNTSQIADHLMVGGWHDFHCM